MRPVTIIEGGDGTGKTTLAERGFTDCDYYHQGPYHGDPFNETLALLLHEQSRLDGRGLVFDRLHIGEQVYGPLCRGKDTLPPHERRMLERVLLSLRAVLVLATPPDEMALRAWRLRQNLEMFKDEELIRKSLRLFGTVQTCLPVVWYNYVAMTPAQARLAVEVKRPAANEGPGIGNWAPGHVILMVGERCNDERGLPFVSKTGSSPWLAKLLDQWGVEERHLYWVNALDEHGEWQDSGFLTKLRPRAIVSLGATATQWADAAWDDPSLSRFKYHVVHPAFQKRFRHDQHYHLEEVLRDALAHL